MTTFPGRIPPRPRDPPGPTRTSDATDPPRRSGVRAMVVRHVRADCGVWRVRGEPVSL